MAKFCTECGYALPEGARFCENCGAPCAPAEEQPAAPYSESQANTYAAAPILTPGEQPAEEYQPAPSYGDPYQQQPAESYGQPYADPYAQQPYGGYSGAPEPVKKSKTGLIIALSGIAVALAAAAIIIFVIWKPFDKKDGDTQPTVPATAAATEATQPATHAPATQAPTEPSETEAPTQQATDAPSQTDSITAADRTIIQQLLSQMVEYGYARNADVINYLNATFQYNFYLDPDDREALYEDISEYFYDDIYEFMDEYGSDYEISATVKDITPLTGEEYEDELAYLDDCDLSGVQMIVIVTAEVKISGSKDSYTTYWTWEFLKVNGQWYPTY